MIFDIIILAALVVSCVVSFFRGFIREVLTILGVVGGAVASFTLAPVVAPVIGGWLGVKPGADNQPDIFGILPADKAAIVFAYGGIFLVVVIVLSIFSHFLSKGAKAVGLGAVDRSMGVVFGLARALVILSLIYFAAAKVIDQKTLNGFFAESKAIVFIETGATWIDALMPKELSDDADKQVQSIKNKAAETTRDRLKRIDILGGDDEVPPPETPKSDDPGYDQDQRREMQDLIKQEGRTNQ